MSDEGDQSDKTEDPSQKKLDDALERGDVVKSQEVSTWFVLAGGTLVLMTFSGSAGSALKTTLGGVIAHSHGLPANGPALLDLTARLGRDVLGALGVPMLLLLLAALGGNLIQHRLVWSAESLKPKLNKISPGAGFKRLFSKIAMANFLKGLLKIALLGTVMTVLLWPERRRMEDLISTDPAALLPISKSIALDLLGTVLAILAVIAAGDYLFQYRQWFNKQKMSVQELKEEFKQTEGDPSVKGKMRQLRQARMKKRMMADVPKAAVIITNPTHFAVALQYDRGMNAPVCVAKGVDVLALKIREIAAKHDIPVVENPPLARALHATVEVDQEVPPEHYKAVAEVIGYVMRLRRAFGR
jgi:flagellar biosynthetic protein FlhB